MICGYRKCRREFIRAQDPEKRGAKKKYCSPGCTIKESNARARDRLAVPNGGERICRYCGKKFERPKRVSANNVHYCSDTCGTNGTKKRKRERLALERRGDKKPWEKNHDHHRNVRPNVEFNHDPNFENCIYC